MVYHNNRLPLLEVHAKRITTTRCSYQNYTETVAQQHVASPAVYASTRRSLHQWYTQNKHAATRRLYRWHTQKSDATTRLPSPVVRAKNSQATNALPSPVENEKQSRNNMLPSPVVPANTDTQKNTQQNAAFTSGTQNSHATRCPHR